MTSITKTGGILTIKRRGLASKQISTNYSFAIKDAREVCFYLYGKMQFGIIFSEVASIEDEAEKILDPDPDQVVQKLTLYSE